MQLLVITCGVPFRIIIVSNQLPIKAKRSSDGSWDFEWDKWGLMKQAGVCTCDVWLQYGVNATYPRMASRAAR